MVVVSHEVPICHKIEVPYYFIRAAFSMLFFCEQKNQDYIIIFCTILKIIILVYDIY